MGVLGFMRFNLQLAFEWHYLSTEALLRAVETSTSLQQRDGETVDQLLQDRHRRCFTSFDHHHVNRTPMTSSGDYVRNDELIALFLLYL